MAKGGFTGAVPPRETSPEEYSGVWDITEQYGEQKAGSWPFQADDCAPKSLRFDGSSSNLEKTFAASGNRTAWSWSCWLKRGRMDLGRQVVFGSYNAANDDTWLEFGLDNTNAYYTTNSISGLSAAALRDPAAFYHYFANFDGTTFKIFINNVEVLSSTSLAGTRGIAGPYRHRIGQSPSSHAGNIRYFDGVMAECHFIDSQVLSPSDFAFYDGQGIWQPKRFTGDYSSGPVYSNNSTGGAFHGSGSWAQAFDGKLTTGPFTYSSTSNTLTLPPGVTWKNKIRVYALRYGGVFKINGTDVTSGLTTTPAWKDLTATLGSSGTLSTIEIGDVGTNYVKLFAVELDDVILTDASVGRNSFHLDFSDGVKDQSGVGNDWGALNLNLGGDFTYSSAHGSNVTTAEFAKMVDSDLNTYGEPSGDFIGFAFAGEKITVKIQNTDANAKLFYIQPAVNTSFNFANSGTWSVSGGSASGNQWTLNANSTETGTFTVPSNYAGTGRFYFSGNNTDFRIYDISPASDTESTKDISVDSPVNGNEASTGAGSQRRGNYATLNPLSTDINGSATLTDGNLKLSATTFGHYIDSRSTIAASSLDCYCEMNVTEKSTASLVGLGIGDITSRISSGTGSYIAYRENGEIRSYPGNNLEGTINSYTAGDVIGMAVSSSQVKFYKNGSLEGTFSHSLTGDFFVTAMAYHNGNNSVIDLNFGQRSFSNAAPAGFSPLATSFLPEPTIKRGDEAMDVALWTGNNSTNKIGNLRLSPDLVWIKARSPYALNHELYDTVRGAGNLLRANTADLEASATRFSSFDSDGFTLSVGQPVNGLNETHVGWVWDAGDSTTTIAAGGLNSSAYNTSQVWTNYSGDQTTKSPSNAFDGNSSTNFGFPTSAGNGNSGTFTFSITGANKIRIRAYTGYATTSNGGFEVNSVDIQSQITTTPQWITISGSSLSSIYMAKGNSGSGNFDPVLEAVEVDGKILVDSTATPSNVPLVATDVRARTDAGFSIAKWSKSANNQSYAHGLSQAPEFIIAKSLDGGHSWRVWHKDLDNNKNLLLDGSGQQDTYTDMLGVPTSYQVPLIAGGPGATNGGMIAYNFHSVEGYCHVGSYEGGSAPFVFCGFRPRFIYIKNADTNGEEHVLFDAARDVDNPAGAVLYANTAGVEFDGNGASNQRNIDFLSNGFKVNTGNPINSSGTHVFVAWAEHPFASNCRAR